MGYQLLYGVLAMIIILSCLLVLMSAGIRRHFGKLGGRTVQQAEIYLAAQAAI